MDLRAWIVSTRPRTAIVVVLVIGYSTYGGVDLATMAVHDAVARDDPPPERAFDHRSERGDRVGTFEFVPVDAGFDYEYQGSTRGGYMDALSNAGVYTGDYDGDGWPDLFVYQYGDFTDGDPIGFRNYSTPVNGDNGNPNVLYRGTGSGFERAEAPAIRGSRWSLAASFVDFTGDGRPDIHVANDFNHDVVYVNRGNGTFEQVVLPERTNRNGMSSEVADVTGDGNSDSVPRRPLVFGLSLPGPPNRPHRRRERDCGGGPRHVARRDHENVRGRRGRSATGRHARGRPGTTQLSDRRTPTISR